VITCNLQELVPIFIGEPEEPETIVLKILVETMQVETHSE
jgi:hypothetical protein